MFKKFVYLIFVMITAYSLSYAQFKDNISLSFLGGYGGIIGTTNFLTGNNIDNKNINQAFSFSFEIDKTTNGSKSWHHLYNDFHYGLGLFYAQFNYSKNLNNPFAVYVFWGFQPYKTNKFQFTTNVAVGFSGIWDVYSEKNIYNDAISMPVEAYVHGRITMDYIINKNFSTNLSLSYIHFSNGLLKKPNFGINLPSAQIGIKYYPNEIKKYQPEDTLKKYKTYNHIINMYYASQGMLAKLYDKPNNYFKDTTKYIVQQSFPIVGLNYRFQKRFTYSHSLGIGFEIAYNNTYNKNEEYFYNNEQDNLSFYDKIMSSLFINYEYHINNLSVLLEPGVYLKQHNTSKSSFFYQRIGFRYYLYEGLFIETTLRAYNFCIADFVQFSIGYRF